MPMTLDQIGIQHGTDKASGHHNYLATYDQYLEPRRGSLKTIMEIGVQTGASLKLWRDYFPKANVLGIDCDPACGELKLGERITVIIEDAASREFWSGLNKLCVFEIIIDDGSHELAQTKVALEYAWPLVAPGGLYIIEDLHSIFHPKYCQPGVNAEQDERWSLFTNRIQNMSEGAPALCGNADQSQCSIRFMHFYRSLLIIGKR